jgi:hypothetical protein
MELLEQYLTTNALGAEAAMLQLERYTREWEKAGYHGHVGGIKLDQSYAGVYSRLYLVEKALGKEAAADQYYQQAARYWGRFYVADGRAHPTPEEIRQQIEKVDSSFIDAPWKH